MDFLRKFFNPWGVLTHLDCSSLTDSWTLSHADCSLLLSGVDWPLASPFANCQLLSPFVSLSDWRSLPTSGHVEISSPNLLSGFAPKQTKGSSAWRTTYIELQPAEEQNRQTPCEYKDEGKSPNILRDKNHQDSSQKI